MDSEDRRSYENMIRAARRMLERTENKREIAQYMYKYNSRTLCGGGGFLGMGDIMMGVSGGLVSSRGMAVMMSPEEITALVDGGALDKLFNMDDLNAPDFSKVFGKVAAKIGAQRLYKDAKAYYKSKAPGLETAIAVYDAPGTEMGAVSVEAEGGKAVIRSGVRKDLDTAFRQCSYEEFNPGGRELLLMAAETAPEKGNKTSAYERLKRDYLQNGENGVNEPGAVPRPEDAVKSIPGFEKMSAAEKLSAMREATDRYDEYQKALQEQEATRQAGEAWVPKYPGSGITGDI